MRTAHRWEPTMKDKLELLRGVIDAHGIAFHVFRKPYDNIEQFDGGIRNQLFCNYDFNFVIHKWETEFRENKLYLVEDVLGVSYIIFLYIDEEKKETQFISIGPYLEEESPNAGELVVRLGLDLYHVQILTEYFNGIVISNNIEYVVCSLMQNIFYEDQYEIEQTSLDMHEQNKVGEKQAYDGIRFQEESMLVSSVIEGRYKVENEMLLAIAQGDITKATLALGKISNYRFEARTADSLREHKNSMLILNVLCRKAVQEAKVHPAHIDEVSATFARRIEVSRNLFELNKVCSEIIRKYCLLVKNYSLRGYSEMIEEALNYIHFNLTGNLSLKNLSEELSVNASYLSSQFKKEVGQTITDYVNNMRIQQSLVLLTTTRLPIQKVAEMVGFLDENYFTKLFKKYKEMTPKDYRNTLTGADIKEKNKFLLT